MSRDRKRLANASCARFSAAEMSLDYHAANRRRRARDFTRALAQGAVAHGLPAVRKQYKSWTRRPLVRTAPLLVARPGQFPRRVGAGSANRSQLFFARRTDRLAVPSWTRGFTPGAVQSPAKRDLVPKPVWVLAHGAQQPNSPARRLGHGHVFRHWIERAADGCAQKELRFGPIRVGSSILGLQKGKNDVSTGRSLQIVARVPVELDVESDCIRVISAVMRE